MANYADIIGITAPDKAIAGSTVYVVASIRNIHSYGIYIRATGKFDNTTLYFSPDYRAVDPMDTGLFSAPFTMPNKNVKVYVYSEYWSSPNWYKDDEGVIDVKLEELVPSISDFKITNYVKV